jgi:glycosyltransferase involved in cell wall biosynthesis
VRIALAWLDPSDPTDRAVATGLGRALKGRGHRVLLVGPRRRRGEARRSRVAGLPLFRVTTAAELLELHRDERVDAWHCHAFARGHAPLERAARLGRWPLVVTPHLVLEDYLRFAGGERGLGALLRGAGAVTAVCGASRRELAARFPFLRGVRVIHNGAAAGAGLAARAGGGGVPFALCAARLAPYKGQDLLLMAFARLADARPDARLVLCGRDQTRGGMRRLARALGVADRVRFMGAVPPARARRLMGRCRVFVLPSRRENFPLALLEAMRAGAPVAAAAAGGVAELARDGREALLTRPGDIEGLAAALRRLWDDAALRRRLSRSARRRARDFTWERAAAAYEKAYDAARRDSLR